MHPLTLTDRATLGQLIFVTAGIYLAFRIIRRLFSPPDPPKIQTL